MICRVYHNQPWFVVSIILSKEKKEEIKFSSLLEFSFSTKRFDYIKNHQAVDWKTYRRFCTFMSKHIKTITLTQTKEIIRRIKFNKVNNCENQIFGNKSVSAKQLEGVDYTPSHFRHINDHCDKPWYECF